MFVRRDPLVTAARCVLQGDSLARDEEHHGTRVTVGDFHVLPNSITTIPGEVVFTVDIRDTDSARQRGVAEKLGLLYRECAAQDQTVVHIERIGDTSPVYLPREIVDELSCAAADCGADALRMTSGASHDAQQISHIVPTGMIFVPSREGLSHVPEEYTSSAQIARGTDVLISTLRRLDERP
jgi:hydantoinase/carbamoylase family amidase